jgi:molybdenum cofactor cytidylyltransferase
MSVACTILAAGETTTDGVPTELVRFHDSGTLVHWTAQCACGSRCSRVSVVLGARAAEISESIVDLPVEIIRATDWREGSAAAVRAAARWAMERMADALLVCSSDQPFLTTRHLNALWYASEHGTRLVASYYSGKAGVPTVIPERYFEELLALQGDENVATLLRRASGTVCIAWPEGAIEVDSPSEVSQAH